MGEYQLVDLLTFTRDGEWGKGEPEDGFVPMQVIRGTDFERVRYGNLSTLPIRYIRSDIAERKAIKGNDILIETAGGTKDQPTGRTVLITEKTIQTAHLPLICASFARFLRPDPRKVDAAFLFWKLQSEYIAGRLFPFHVQHTGVARFQYTQFAESHSLAIPDKSKQRNIASTLSALDDKIELNRRMNETLEAMARAIFRDWFVDFGPTRTKVRGGKPYLAEDRWSLFPDTLNADGIPEGWEAWSVDEIALHHKRTTSPAADPEQLFEHHSIPAFDNGQQPVVEAGASIKSNKTLVPEGAILLSKLNPDIERVWFPDPPSGPTQVSSTEFLAFTPKPPAGRCLLYCLFSDPGFRQTMQGMVTGTSKSHQRVSPKALMTVAALSGAEDVFAAFEGLAGPLFQRFIANRIESRTLAQTRDLLLPKLMSGEIRLRDAEKAVEEVV